MTFFTFYHINSDKMLKILENLDSKKAAQQGDPRQNNKRKQIQFFKNFIRNV